MCTKKIAGKCKKLLRISCSFRSCGQERSLQKATGWTVWISAEIFLGVILAQKFESRVRPILILHVCFSWRIVLIDTVHL